MTERLDRAVLEALGAHPDDDALRGVVADALLEAGDARGEFISLVRRQPLPATARKRAAKLFARHRAAWLGPVADVALTGSLGGRTSLRAPPSPSTALMTRTPSCGTAASPCGSRRRCRARRAARRRG